MAAPRPRRHARRATIALAALALRAATGLHPYSGEGTPPLYGDFEAQRHWMELALALPPRLWYREAPGNDLAYWGMDYPPLSGYASAAAGAVLRAAEPAAVALRESRGHESPRARALMRGSVLVADALCFVPAVVWCAARGAARGGNANANADADADGSADRVLAFVLSLPALLLIDHAHFQYNGVSLGLFVASAAAMADDMPAVGTVLFSLSVYFKQMNLYYAPAVATYLLAVMARKRPLAAMAAFALRVSCAVVGTTVAVFFPWLPGDLEHVLRRIFPVARGLFEDKVANVWCTLSLLYKFKEKIPHAPMFRLCLLCTVLACAPFCVAVAVRPTRRQLLLSAAGTSLAAYLFSYQVHEKQILIPLVPVSLLSDQFPVAALWFSLTASLSLFPLLARERLTLPYFALALAHIVSVDLSFNLLHLVRVASVKSAGAATLAFAALVTATLLHIAKLFGPTFLSKPDLYTVLITAYSCVHFCLIYLWLVCASFPAAAASATSWFTAVTRRAKAESVSVLEAKKL